MVIIIFGWNQVLAKKKLEEGFFKNINLNLTLLNCLDHKNNGKESFDNNLL